MSTPDAREIVTALVVRLAETELWMNDIVQPTSPIGRRWWYEQLRQGNSAALAAARKWLADTANAGDGVRR